MNFLSSLRQNVDTLELRIEELSKQIEELTHNLETEKRKNERLRESSVNESPAPAKPFASKVRHMSSASEPENEEVCNRNSSSLFDSKTCFSIPKGFNTSKSIKDIQ
jgi:TolA-binding protein